MNSAKCLLGICAVALGFAVDAACAADDAKVEQLSAMTPQWWQWVQSIPAAANPLLDETGANCMVGQRGTTWFLAGATSGKPTVRACTVPEGQALFFPVLNANWVNTPECGEPVYTIAQMRALIAPGMDGATGLSVVLDGMPVAGMRRVRSNAFVSVFPEQNLWGASCLVAGKLYPRSVDDGYYMMLQGLAQGMHTLNIRGTSMSGFTVEVTYTLDVVNASPRN